MITLRCCQSFSRKFLTERTSIASSLYLLKHNQRSCSQSVADENVVPVYLKCQSFQHRTAIIDQHSRYSYANLLSKSYELREKLLKILSQKVGQAYLEGHRIAFLCENDFSYVVALFSIFMCDGIAVPLGQPHQKDDLHYRLSNAQCSCVLYTKKFKDRIQPVANALRITHKCIEEAEYNSIDSEDLQECAKIFLDMRTRISEEKFNFFKNQPALMIYTSGTTANPKGVLISYGNLQAQIEGMMEAWQWSPDDVILHTLPLYHVHGITNALLTPLYVGATCVMLPSFDPEQVWRWLTGQQDVYRSTTVTIFMGVPTMYAKLLQFLSINTSVVYQNQIRECLAKIRLMVSGSDALPAVTLNSWFDLTGHFLLERYGMTELGMVLTNDIEVVTGPSNQEQREEIVGSVGNPFPGVTVRITKHEESEENKESLLCPEGEVLCEGTSNGTDIMIDADENTKISGELWVKGDNVFLEYWNNPDATAKEFSPSGWFRTGDFAEYTGKVYKILGRTSVDIIKHGGYKISALQVERVLSTHPNIQEVAVIGKPDKEWGQRVAAAVVPKLQATVTLEDIRSFCEDKLPRYQVPSIIEIVEKLPRNNLGKVSKKLLVKELYGP